jgi:hypothetical protein
VTLKGLLITYHTAWANSWQFSMNTTKITVLNLNNTVSSAAVRSYSVDVVIFSRSNVVSDLGILTYNCLIFRDHIFSSNPSLMRKAFITNIRLFFSITPVSGTQLINN